VEEKLAGKDDATIAKFVGIYKNYITATAKRQHGLTAGQVEQASKLVELATESRMKAAILTKLKPATEVADEVLF
jgi:hypothetical protein